MKIVMSQAAPAIDQNETHCCPDIAPARFSFRRPRTETDHQEEIKRRHEKSSLSCEFQRKPKPDDRDLPVLGRQLYGDGGQAIVLAWRRTRSCRPPHHTLPSVELRDLGGNWLLAPLQRPK